MNRSDLVSILYGVGAAVAVALVGPVYATPVLIVAFPVVFLTVSRAVTGSTIEANIEWLLFAFAVAWFLLVPLSPIVRRSLDIDASRWPLWLFLGVVPLLAAATLAVRRRLIVPRTSTEAD